nr:hypothetical protein [Tanacetum cinerariifolium]
QRLFYGHGSGHGLAPGSAHGWFPFDDDEDNSPAEEVSPVKPKKPSKHATKTKKDDPNEGKEAPKEWTVAEEIALCQADKFFNMKQKKRKEGQGTTILFRDEESGVEYPRGRGSRNCIAEKGKTRNSTSSA